MHRKLGILGQMRNDDLAYAIGVDEAEVEDERDEMAVQNDGLQVKIDSYQNPPREEGEKAIEGFSR